MTDDAHVPPRIVCTEDGKPFHKYEVSGVSSSSAATVTAEFEARSSLQNHD